MLLVGEERHYVTVSIGGLEFIQRKNWQKLGGSWNMTGGYIPSGGIWQKDVLVHCLPAADLKLICHVCLSDNIHLSK